MCCVVRWLFLAMIRAYVVMYVVCEWITLLSGFMCCSVGFLLLLETRTSSKTQSKSKSAPYGPCKPIRPIRVSITLVKDNELLRSRY